MSTAEPDDLSPPPPGRVLSGDEVENMGVAFYGRAWATAMAKDLGISTRSAHGYRLKGVSGAQASALIGLLARKIHDRRDAEAARRADEERQQANWFGYLRKYEARLRGDG